MEPEAFLNSRSPAYEFIYNNESELEPLQYPLAFSRYKVPRFANELYSDDVGEYFTYSGSNSVIVTKEKEGRYKNLTLKAYSGDSFKFYFQVGSGIADSDMYFSGPLTTSGVYSTMTLYATQSGALANAITFSAPTNNSSVYTLPTIQNLNWIRLYHSSVSGTTPYRIYQFMPRTLIQVDDLEADVIDAVTVRVSDSIVIGPNMIGDKTILGQKIVDGTLSGILMTDGTITGSKVVARTISGILITAGTIKGENIEALTISGSLITADAITAGKIAAGTITFDKIASNTLTSGQIADGTITGQKIVDGTISGVLISNGTITGSKVQANTISGVLISANTITATNIAVSGITADRLNVTQLDAVAANMGNLVVNSGISIGTNGTIWAGSGSVATPTTGLKIYTTSGVSRLTTYSGGVAQVDITSNGKLKAGFTVLDETGITIGSTSDFLYGTQSLKIKNASSEALQPGGIDFYDGDYSTTAPVAQIYGSMNQAIGGALNLTSDNIRAIGTLRLSNGSVTVPSLTFNSDSDTGFYSNGSNFIRVSTGGTQSAVFGADRFLISDGTVSLPALQFINDTNTGIYSVSADVLGIATGGVQRASISNTTTNFVNKVTSNEMGYLTVRRTTDVAITTAGTTITWQSVTRSGNISVPVPSDTITVDNAGYYMFSATFATVANLTSLRMTLVRGGVNYVSTLHGAALGTGVGYIFNFSVGFWSTAGSTYKVILTPSANTTLIASAEATAGPSPIINIFQAIGV